MKTIKYLWTLCLALAAFTLTACSDDDNGGSSAAMQINQIYLENVDDEVNQDRPVEFARLGQLLRIEGSGFSGLKKIYVNGYETYFNNALMTDNNVWVTLNAATPIDKADADVRNTIVFYKNDNNKLVYEFTIRAAAPAVTSVDNTLPKAGETVTVYGANLQETTKITLPDGTEITDGIRNDADGNGTALPFQVLPTSPSRVPSPAKVPMVQPSHQPISTTSATSLPISMEMANWVHGVLLTEPMTW